MARQIKRNTGKKTKKTAANGVAHIQSTFNNTIVTISITFAGGAYGFLVFGSILTVLAPYFNYQLTFYEFFLAFAAGRSYSLLT